MVQSSLSCQELRALYMRSYEDNKEALDKRMTEGIERNRKGDCLLTVLHESGHPIPNTQVQITQIGHDFKYGANIFMLDEFESSENNAKYRALFKDYFNLATVPFYWDALEPEEGQLRFAEDSKKIYRRPAPDLCIKYCEENGILPKLHCLFYDKFSPKWAYPLSQEELENKLETRIRQIAQRYRGKLYEFEVVNELLCFWDEKTALFRRKDLVKWAFDLARKYLPEETLVINETFPIHNLATQKYRNSYYQLVENALLKGAPIDKVGIQNHLFTGVCAHTDKEYDDSIKKGVWMNDMGAVLGGLDILHYCRIPTGLCISVHQRALGKYECAGGTYRRQCHRCAGKYSKSLRNVCLQHRQPPRLCRPYLRR